MTVHYDENIASAGADARITARAREVARIIKQPQVWMPLLHSADDLTGGIVGTPVGDQHLEAVRIVILGQ
jgi:hypothetical protein